jgi:DNA transformation protein and related proteins
LELLAPLGTTRAKSMFGGHGLYVDEIFIALVAFDRLYLKTNADTQPRFVAAGCQPFTYEAHGKTMSMAYYTAPDEALDSPALMQPWARWALQAALAARAGKTTPPKKPNQAKAAPKPVKARANRGGA